jgi:hypothetical protein
MLQTFFGTGWSEIPEELNSRYDGYLFVFGTLVFLSFLALALVKRSNHRVFFVLLQLVINSAGLEQKMKDSLKLSSFASITLLLNYLVLFGVCTFLFLTDFEVFSWYFKVSIALTLPIFLLLMHVFFVVMINWLVGANLPIGFILGNTFVILESAGVLLSLLALFWILNPEYSGYAIWAFLIVLFMTQLMRVAKNSFAVLSTGVSWYYILLYFCTLEILPLFVAYYYVQLNFMK